MATIDEILDEDEDILQWHMPYALKPLYGSDLRKSLFAPLHEAGFTDFTFCGGGTSSFFIAPTDNDKIVFRITREAIVRRNDIPFFLAGLLINEQIAPYQASEKPLRLEMLLAGTGYPPKEKLEELKKAMSRAGWDMQYVDQCELEADAITITLRDKGGRMKTVPIISDPSMMQRRGMQSALPEGAENVDGTLNSTILNRCSGDYITLQDQAAAYNAAREADPRLQKLIPKEIEFPVTEIVSLTTQLPPPL